MVTKEVEMHKDTLAKITERTIMTLINEHVVMPSRYLETFLEETQKVSCDINEASLPVTEEITNISALKKMEEKLYGTANESCTCDLDGIRSDLALLRKQLFSDDVTKARNRVWLYHYKLSEEKLFLDSGIVAFVRLNEYRDIVGEYGVNTWHILLGRFYDTLVSLLKEKGIACEIVRYSEESFFLFFSGTDEENTKRHLRTLQKRLEVHTFKQRSKMFRLTIVSAVMQYIPRESFDSVLSQLDEKLIRQTSGH